MALKMYQPLRIHRQINSSKHIKIDLFLGRKCSQLLLKISDNLCTFA